MSIYKADGYIKTVAAGINTPPPSSIRLRGLSGSLDALVLAASFKLHPHDYLVILQDREEALYFINDLQNLLDREILMFPMSARRSCAT